MASDGFWWRPPSSEQVGFCFYSTVLGNVAFDETHGPLHLISELGLCIMFCVYVYLIYWQNRQGLKSLEAKAVRASDFAVKVALRALLA